MGIEGRVRRTLSTLSLGLAAAEQIFGLLRERKQSDAADRRQYAPSGDIVLAVAWKRGKNQVWNLIVQKYGDGMKVAGEKTEKFTPANAGQARPKRILLADDNKAIRDIISGCLEFIGYEVALAMDGIEALAVFLKSPFDLVLTDYEMPAMDGLRLAGHIKARSPNTPVILLTGTDREHVLKRVEKGLVDSVIFKPFLLENLESAVLGVLASSDQKTGGAGSGQPHDVSREAPRIAQCL